ncbi:uncharacterized protein isoform X2 [Leptinotarsa decemlineata]|uniref:uncharacterized protein isoform X2 n=1 Tax=Leptinotarsa decemlineata TaxID=7539 RepID=UPI003D306D23
METRSKSRALKSKIEVPNNDSKRGENKISSTKLGQSSRISNVQSTKSHREQSVVSKASTKYQRKRLEAQLKADEELASLLNKQMEMEKKLIEDRLTLEQTKLEEQYDAVSDDMQFKDRKELSSQDSYEKVGDWLRNKVRVDRFSDEKSDKKSSKMSHSCHSQCQCHIVQPKNDVNLDISSNESVSGHEIKMLLARQAIEKDLPIFSGEITEWPSFYQQYIFTTKMLGLSSEENMWCVEGLLLSASSMRFPIGLLHLKPWK